VNRTNRFFRRSVLGTMLLLAGVATANDETGPESPTRDDGWRRTADGWEIWPQRAVTITTRTAIASIPRIEPLPFPGSAHPAAWAGLQLSLSLLALGAFPASEE
jgi:hypothetical protein